MYCLHSENIASLLVVQNGYVTLRSFNCVTTTFSLSLVILPLIRDFHVICAVFEHNFKDTSCSYVNFISNDYHISMMQGVA